MHTFARRGRGGGDRVGVRRRPGLSGLRRVRSSRLRGGRRLRFRGRGGLRLIIASCHGKGFMQHLASASVVAALVIEERTDLAFPLAFSLLALVLALPLALAFVCLGFFLGLLGLLEDVKARKQLLLFGGRSEGSGNRAVFVNRSSCLLCFSNLVSSIRKSHSSLRASHVFLGSSQGGRFIFLRGSSSSGMFRIFDRSAEYMWSCFGGIWKFNIKLSQTAEKVSRPLTSLHPCIFSRYECDVQSV